MSLPAVLWFCLLALLMLQPSFASYHSDQCWSGGSRHLAVSIPEVASIEGSMHVSFSLHFGDNQFHIICLDWEAEVIINGVVAPSVDVCQCQQKPESYAVCTLEMTADFASAHIATEVLLTPRIAEKRGCSTGSSWIRTQAEIFVPSKTESSSGALPSEQTDSFAGIAEFDTICQELSPMQAIDGGLRVPPGAQVLVTAADSLLPETVTALPSWLTFIRERAPHQHVAICDVGSGDLKDHISLLSDHEMVFLITPNWSSFPRSLRALAFRSICMASVLCTNDAIWIDTDRRLDPDLEHISNRLRLDGHWLIQLPSEVIAGETVLTNTAHETSEGRQQVRVAMTQFGFVKGSRAFDAIFLPMLAELFSVLSGWDRVCAGAAASERSWERGSDRDIREVVLSREERTVAGSLEKRVMGNAVASAGTSGGGSLSKLQQCMCQKKIVPRPGEEEHLHNVASHTIASCKDLEGKRVGSLSELMRVSGTDKLWKHAYDRYYESSLAALRYKKGVRVLELGFGLGHSLDLWLNYFESPGAVHVLTLDPVPSGQLGSVEWVKQVHGDRAAAFRLFFGDQGDESVMATVLAEGARLPPHQPVPALWDAWWQSEGGYDLIIDDASHHPALQIFSLARLLPAVRPGGLFIVEDLETSYMDAKPTPSIFGRSLVGSGVGKPPPGNAVSKFKELVEVLHRWHIGVEELTVLGREADSNLFSVTFGAGLALLRKATPEQSLHTPRIRKAYLGAYVDSDSVRRWAKAAAETNPF